MTKLEKVRAKIIEVKVLHMCAEYGISNEMAFACIGEMRLGIAAVLIAIQKAYEDKVGMMGIHSDGDFIRIGLEEYTGAGVSWNLHKDSLDDQGEETINFLYDILCSP